MATRVVILGGGFGGLYAALGFDRDQSGAFEVTVIDRDNFFLFTPMLSEIASSSIDTRHIVNPIRRMFRRVHFMEAEVTDVDFGAQTVDARLPTGEQRSVPYDELVIALGSVTNYFGLPGVEQHALPVKTLGDAIVLRNRVIQRLEEADVSPKEQRKPLLTFVMGGGNLTGIEITGDINDFVRDALKAYPGIDAGEPRVLLVEAGPRLMGELPASLAEFARQKLTERGVEVYTDAAVQSATADSVTVGGLGAVPTRNLIWTAGVAPTPFVKRLGLLLEKGRILTDGCMRVDGHDHVWAIGDVARIPDNHGAFYPMTAQHAMREGAHVARSIRQVAAGGRPTPFRYRTMGMMATIGHRTGVGQIMGINVSGFFAWWLWRSYYLFRLPRLEKRVRVVIDWTLDLVFPRDIVQLKVTPSDKTSEDSNNANQNRLSR